MGTLGQPAIPTGRDRGSCPGASSPCCSLLRWFAPCPGLSHWPGGASAGLDRTTPLLPPPAAFHDWSVAILEVGNAKWFSGKDRISERGHQRPAQPGAVSELLNSGICDLGGSLEVTLPRRANFRHPLLVSARHWPILWRRRITPLKTTLLTESPTQLEFRLTVKVYAPTVPFKIASHSNLILGPKGLIEYAGRPTVCTSKIQALGLPLRDVYNCQSRPLQPAPSPLPIWLQTQVLLFR